MYSEAHLRKVCWMEVQKAKRGAKQNYLKTEEYYMRKSGVENKQTLFKKKVKLKIRNRNTSPHSTGRKSEALNIFQLSIS